MKNKYFILIVSILVLLSLSTRDVSAMDKTARRSAQLISQNEIKIDKRVESLTRYLESKESPLAPHAAKFIDEADKNNLDWKLLISIAGVESYFGQRIPPNSYNGWGWGVYGNNVHRFTSWDEAITTISYELRTRYMEEWGATNVYEIGEHYAADPKWANKVNHFMNDIDSFAKKEDVTLLSISL